MQLNPLETSNSHSFTNVMREAIVQFTSSENIRAGFQVGSTIQPWVPAHVMLLGRKLRSNPQEARADRGSHQQSNTVILSGVSCECFIYIIVLLQFHVSAQSAN